MDADGAPRDDLDVRLDWPEDADPAGPPRDDLGSNDRPPRVRMTERKRPERPDDLGPAGPGGQQPSLAGPEGHQQGPAGPGGRQQGPQQPDRRLLEDINRTVRGTEEALRWLHRAVEHLGTQLQTFVGTATPGGESPDTAQLAASLDGLQEMVAGLGEDQVRLTSETLSRVEEAVDALLEERQHQAAALAQLADLQDLVSRLTDDHVGQPTLAGRLDRLEQRIDDVLDALVAPTPQPGSRTDDRLLAELEMRFDEFLAAMADQVDLPAASNNQTALGEIEARLDDVVGLLSDQEQTIARLEGMVVALEARVAAGGPDGGENGQIMARLERLGDQVEGLRRRIAVRGRLARPDDTSPR